MSPSVPEVLIVGAGPAGSALALRLARAGRDVLVLERRPFPRDKPCGDFVNPGAVRELHRLGVADRLSRRCAPRPLTAWTIEAPDGSGFHAPFGAGANGGGPTAVGWAVRRRDLDQALLEEAVGAGARARFGVRAYDLIRERGRVVGVVVREGSASREIRAGLVVGADGLRSVVQRRLGLSARPPRLRKLALVGHLRERVDPGSGRAGNGGVLRVGGSGVCGYLRLQASANVTLVVGEEEAPGISGDPAGYLARGLADFPDVAGRLASVGLEPGVMVTGPFDRPLRRRCAPGVLLVGDAAGYYDPFTGQGIYRALRSAALAASAIERALVGGDDGASRAFAAYDRRLAREFGPGRHVQRLIESILRRPSILCGFVRALSREPEAATRLLRVTGDLDAPVRLLGAGFWARLLRGAWAANVLRKRERL